MDKDTPESEILCGGLDVGSTTAKLIILNGNNQILFSLYRRHGSDIDNTLAGMFETAEKAMGSYPIQLSVTGSAGMGIAERTNIVFVQEVVAAGDVVQGHFPEVQTMVDIGGEDSKIIFLEPGNPPDIRMNGSCAGGTGAFIDQMASLLNISLFRLNELALEHSTIYPIASRCGVFAKTDVQNLISRRADKSDICASILQAVVLQNLNTLARGKKIKAKVLFCGGPLTFLPALQKCFCDSLKLSNKDVTNSGNGEFFPAWGAALKASGPFFTLDQWRARITQTKKSRNAQALTPRLSPLFDAALPYSQWIESRQPMEIPTIDFNRASPPFFLGIDAGSTTTKVMVIDARKRVLFKDYRPNLGNPVNSIQTSLTLFNERLPRGASPVVIAAGSVTGYGEELIRAALNLDHGVVETMAHLRAAVECNPCVSFILDIGGQDMKAIFVKDQGIHRIEINEACSSGCGSFIEGFAHSLGLSAESFANMACQAQAPCDLGSRCTVFMNSRIKQAQKENAGIENIAAGLAYSVIKNSLYKVLNLRNPDALGDHIVVQGGTFKNVGVVRALEILSGKPIVSATCPEMMGAYGTALLSMDAHGKNQTSTRPLDPMALSGKGAVTSSKKNCSGCTNQCTITIFSFARGKKYYTGNRCEKIYTNQGGANVRGENLFTLRNRLVFKSPMALEKISHPPRIGIPRILGMYESYPFWSTLFTQCKFEVVLSSRSSDSLNQKGMGTVMADNICFPAKLAHGHIMDLVEKKVDRIVYPMAIHEPQWFSGEVNSYNCPIVTGYGEVLKGLIDSDKKDGIPMDTPLVSFRDSTLLKKACRAYLKSLGVPNRTFLTAFENALGAQKKFYKDLNRKARPLIDRAKKTGRPLIVLAGRPYHVDPLIEHGTSEILADLGADILSIDLPANLSKESFENLTTLPQWTHSNRLLRGAQWVANQSDPNIQYVMITSFGCGPDAFIMDEIRDILCGSNKLFTLIKIDEIASTGSVRLRLRSLVETLKWRKTPDKKPVRRIKQKPCLSGGKKTIIAPYVSNIYSQFTSPIYKSMGYELEILPPPDEKSVELGLTYANNEICYPATVMIGDIVKAFMTNRYDPKKVVVAMSQTGGQCRASSYLYLIQKALINAGFPEVQVISLAKAHRFGDDQPGFEFKMHHIIKPAFVSILFTDAIARMAYAAVVRENQPGRVWALRDHYLEKAKICVAQKNLSGLLPLLEVAVGDFNQAMKAYHPLPRIGIVGEIYLRYNQFGQMGVIDWLISQGIEVLVPPLVDFVMQFFVNQRFNQQNFIEPWSPMIFCNAFLKKLADRWSEKFESLLQGFHCPLIHTTINEKANMASPIVSLGNQYGEGWLIAAEIVGYARENVRDIVCLQPFGCISNHVIAKGIEKRIKEFYPDINLLFLDFDGGASEVNILNRLSFMVRSARNQI